MNPCTCTSIKQIVACELERGNGTCLSAQTQPGPPQEASPALGSDALINTIAAKLGATTTSEL